MRYCIQVGAAAKGKCNVCGPAAYVQVVNGSGSEFSPPFWSNEQTSRDRFGQCEREIAGRSDILLWFDGEGDTPGKIWTAFSSQRSSRTRAGARRETKGSPRRQGLLDHCIMRSQRKTASDLRIPIPDETPGRKCRRRGCGFVWAVGEEMKRMLA
jgi:hypothetical protein